MSLLSAIARSEPAPLEIPAGGTFHRFVQEGPPYADLGPCHVWTGGQVKGVPYYRGVPAMRFAVLLQGATPLPGARVYKRCGVSLCVNPDHAYFGLSPAEKDALAQKTAQERTYERTIQARWKLAKETP